MVALASKHDASDTSPAPDAIPCCAPLRPSKRAAAHPPLPAGHATKEDGCRHGIPLAGYHRALIPAIPPPEAFEASRHRPLVVTQNPFAAKEVRGGCRVEAPGVWVLGVVLQCAEGPRGGVEGEVGIRWSGWIGLGCAPFCLILHF